MVFGAALITACAAPVSNERNEKIVFVTKASVQSDMGGLSGADAKCQTEADDPASIVPAGTYLAWLSDGTDSPDTRFTKSSHPYVLPDGAKIAENYADLTDGSILHAINVDASGAPVLGAQRFWTDTMTDGKAAHQFEPNVKRNSCNAWNGTTVYQAEATIGVTYKNTGEWTNYRQSWCNSSGQPKRLICFQQ